MRIVMTVSYDGTDFYGWQRQREKRTVQEEIENALEQTLGKKIRVTASGRTDSGVHAAGQVCQFDADTSIPPEKFASCLNALLPSDVKILSSRRVSDDFDCNRHAKRKTYCYQLYLSDKINPLKERYSVKCPLSLDVEKMRSAAKLLVGEHDFKAFCASGSSAKTTIRTIYSLQIEESESFGGRDLKIYVTGNGFLYNMVRSIAGELVDIGNGRFGEERLEEALYKGDRSLLGRTMPAKGLILMGVKYGNP